MTGHAVDIETAGAGALAKALEAGEVSALHLTEAAIARIERLDNQINAVVVRDFDRARAAARDADARLRRGERGPLLGVPMTVKESYNVAGLPTTWGSPAFAGWIAERDSVAVARLKGAGAIILGKTNVPPFLADWQSDNPVYGRTNHPLDPKRTPGGSSGGAAAAVASGMVPLELGSDIGGSIRVPSGFCGVYGHKPTYGIVPLRGHDVPGFDNAPPVLSVGGPIARNAADLDLALGVLAGPEPEDRIAWSFHLPPPRNDRLHDYRVLIVDQHPAAEVDPEIRAGLHDLAARLERQGVRVARRSERLPDLGAQHEVYTQLLSAAISRGAPNFPPPPDAHRWMALLDRQLAFQRQWAALFEEVDVVLAPTFGVVAFPHDARPFQERIHTIAGVDTPYGAQVAWPGIALLPGIPATAAPMHHRHSSGMPMSVQVIGPYLEDRTSIAFAGLLAGV